MSVRISVRVPAPHAAALDSAVAAGRFASRSAAVRAAVVMLLFEEREREIGEAYRRGYGSYPQEDWIGEAGLAAFARLVAAEEDPSAAL